MTRQSHGSSFDALTALTATSRSLVATDARRPDNPISYANAAFSELCGYSEAEIIGHNCRFLQGPETDPFVRAEIRTAIAAGVSIRREILNYRKDGTKFWNDLTIDPIRDDAGQLVGFVSSQYEATEIHQANEARAEVEARLESIADHVPGYVYRRVMRIDGTIDIDYCSSSAARMLGIDEKDAPQSFLNHVHPADREALVLAIRSSASDLSLFREEFRLISATGVTHWMRSEAQPRRRKNGEIVWDGLAVETTAEKRWEGEIARLALRDPLTNLLTRDGWRQAVGMQFNSNDASKEPCGLMYFDIVAFHELNEKFGQRAGDDILREIAQRIARIAASVDGLAARLGSDEFAILIPNCGGEDRLLEFARACGDKLAVPIQVGDQSLSIRNCVGASFYAGGEICKAAEKDTVSELMTQAELALRWAKRTGGPAPVIYSAAQDDRFRNQTQLAQSLEHAIAHDQLELYYQPLVDLGTGRIVSAEALVRWNHPTLGLQRPDLFIPIAEESGLIVQLGEWVLRQALRQRKLWQDAALAPPPIAINVSGVQLIEPGFVDLVSAALAELQADARDFEIELTESQMIEASPQIMSSLSALRKMGFVITIDDFGSGHATFRYLRDFPVDKVKIDQLFVRKLVLGSNDALIIRAVISLASSMGIVFVAEGIETDMQRDFLKREGCEIGQGYLFSPPVAAQDFGSMLAKGVSLFAPHAADRATPSKKRG